MNRRKLMPALAAPVDRSAIATSVRRDRTAAPGSPVEPSNSQWGWAGNTAKNSLYESLSRLNTPRNVTPVINVIADCDPNQVYCHTRFENWQSGDALPRVKCTCVGRSGGAGEFIPDQRWVPSHEVSRWTAKGWKALPNQSGTTKNAHSYVTLPASMVPQAVRTTLTGHVITTTYRPYDHHPRYRRRW
ncbi:MAG: hypothetical protein AAGE59_39305 [Cyanobacteria bacterium P01_F01_bin.86]